MEFELNYVTRRISVDVYPGFRRVGGWSSSGGTGGRYGSNLAPGTTAPLHITRTQTFLVTRSQVETGHQKIHLFNLTYIVIFY